MKLRAACRGVGNDIKAPCLGNGGKRGGSADRMPGIGIAMTDGSLATAVGLKHGGNAFVDQRCAEREIAACDRLGYAHHVGLHAPQARTTPGACAPETGDHLISDQQDAVPVADLADRRHEAGMRRDHPACPKDWLHDKGGNGAGALEVDFIHKRGDTFGGQRLGVGFVERVAVGVGRRNVETAGEKRLVLGAEIGIAIDTRTAEMRAVIALFQAEKLGA